MPTDTASGRTAAVSFALQGVAWSLAFRPAPSGLDRSACGAAADPTAGRCGGGDVRRAGLAGQATTACSGTDAGPCAWGRSRHPVAWKSEWPDVPAASD